MQITIADSLNLFLKRFAPKPDIVALTPEQAVVEQARAIIALEDAGEPVPAAMRQAFAAAEARTAAWADTLKAKPRSNKATIAHNKLTAATTQQLKCECR